MARQQSIPTFSDSEQKLIDAAMQIECIRTQGVWVHRAALLYARQVIAADAGQLQRVKSLVDDGPSESGDGDSSTEND